DAEGAVPAPEQRRPAVEIGKARPPHQRAVAEDPEVSVRRRQPARLDQAALLSGALAHPDVEPAVHGRAHRRTTSATPRAVSAIPASAAGPSTSSKMRYASTATT